MATTDVCHPKKLRLGVGASGGTAVASSSAATASANRMLQELLRKCSCAVCSQTAAAPVLLAKCGHSVCSKCCDELKRVNGASSVATCGVCGKSVAGEELTKRDHAMEKLLNAVKVLEGHIRSQESQPNLERARCADCLGKASSLRGSTDCGLSGVDGAAAGGEAAARKCEELRQELQRMADDADRGEAERRKALEEAAAELDAWKNKMGQMLTDWHANAFAELENMRQRAEQLLSEEAIKRREMRSAAEDLRRLLEERSGGEAAASTSDPVADLTAGEARATEELNRLGGAVGGSFELARRADPAVLEAGLTALLAQSGLDLVVRPYANSLARPEPRPVRVHRTGNLEPWDLGLLNNTEGLYYTSEGHVKVAGETAGSDWTPLPRPCLVVNYKGFKTKRLHLFDSELKEVASVRLELKDGRMPGTIYVWDQKQIVITVDHSRCKVCQFDLSGKLVRKIGGKGNGPTQFKQPMTAQVHDGLLYVVDSDNKRVQIFQAESLEPAGSLTHEGFSTDIHSVLASETRIVITDRDNAKAFVFDKGSQRLLREVALGGKPFCLISDPEGNLFVSLTNERKILIFDPAMAHRLHTLSVARKLPRRAGRATSSSSAIAAACASASAVDAATSSSAENAAAADDDDEEEEEEEDDEDEESSSSSDDGGGFRGILAGLKKMAGGSSTGKPPFIYGIAFDGRAKRLYVADTFCHAVVAYKL